MTESLGLYIHVPFCGKKCPYCDFYSGSYSKAAAEGYVSAVIRNIRHFSLPELCADTVYFGGGTPSLLSAAQISQILSAIRESFRLDGDAEITLEANPGTVNSEKLAALRDAGVNRLSLGVQSMIPEELAFLGRSHTPERAAKAVLDAHDAGFENISCDLMTALPHQTCADIRHSVNALAELPVSHVSAYILKIEEGTPFALNGTADIVPDDDASAEIYLETVRALEEKDFMQYEISNFARPGAESRHNCRYWKCQDYLGIGPAAHSCFGGKRYSVPRDTAAFIAADTQEMTVTDTSPYGFEERAMLRLRLVSGLDLRTEPEHRARIEKKIPALLNAGYVRFDGNTVSLTPEGFLVSNAVISRLIF